MGDDQDDLAEQLSHRSRRHNQLRQRVLSKSMYADDTPSTVRARVSLVHQNAIAEESDFDEGSASARNLDSQV